jgi:hypothetical protein
MPLGKLLSVRVTVTDCPLYEAEGDWTAFSMNTNQQMIMDVRSLTYPSLESFTLPVMEKMLPIEQFILTG